MQFSLYRFPKSFQPYTSSDKLTDKKIHYRCYTLLEISLDRPHVIHDSDWKDGFLFVGNQISLDFLNTRPVQNEEALELFPDFDAVLRWFRAAGLLTVRATNKLHHDWSKSDRAVHSLANLIEFRERLRDAVTTWELHGKAPESMVAELNQLLNQHPMRTKLNAGGTSTELWFQAREPEDLFAPLAQSAAELFSSADHSRVRKCGQCVLHFLDTSKKGTRRWCSMQLCGNRLKVAAYAKRQRRKRPT
jgi:predicted RNA-binding Zn ribbon-like protein